MLKNEVLEFEKRVIGESEMVEHVNYYYHRALDGLKMLDKEDDAVAMQILKELNKNIKKEHKHYQLLKVAEVVNRSPLAMAYTTAIRDIHANQKQNNTYDKLSSNLFDIQSYMQFHCRKCIQE